MKVSANIRVTTLITKITARPKRAVSLVLAKVSSLIEKMRLNLRPRRKLSSSQIKLLNDIKQHRHPLSERVVRPIDPSRATTPPRPVHTLRSPSSRNLAQPVYPETQFPPAMEEFRTTVREVVSSAADVLFEEKIQGVIEHNAQGTTGHLRDVIDRASAPIMEAITALMKRFKGDDADPEVVRNQLGQLVDYVEGVCRDDLSCIVGVALNHNATKLVDMLTCRALELTELTPINALFDELCRALCTHVDGIAEADKSVNELIALARKAPSARDTAQERQLLQECRDRISTTEGEASFRREIFLQKFSDHQACHPRVKQLMGMREEDQERMMNEVYTKFANEMIDLLLPRRSVLRDGEYEVISGLNYLWDNIEWPPEFHGIRERAAVLLKSILPETEVSGFAQLEDQVIDLLEACAVSLAEDKLRKFFAGKLRGVFNTALTPRELRRAMATNLLPAIDASSLTAIGKLYVVDKVDETAPIFANWLQHPETEKEYKTSLASLLFKAAQEKSARFKYQAAPIAEEAFMEDVGPMLQDMYKAFAAYCVATEQINEQALAAVKGCIDRHIADACCQVHLRHQIYDAMAEEISRNGGIDATAKTVILAVLADRKKAVLKAIKDCPEEPKGIAEQLVFRTTFRLKAALYDAENIKAQIRIYERPEHIVDPSAPPFGDMIVKALFDIGQFEVGSGLVDAVARTDMVRTAIKDAVQGQILGVIHQLREGYSEPLAIATAKLEPFRNKETIRARINAAPAAPSLTEPLSEEQVNDKLNSEITKVSLVLQDILKVTIETRAPAGFLGRLAAKAVVPEVANIESTLKRCLTTIAGEKHVNSSLGLKLHDIFLRTMRTVDEQLQERRISSLSHADVAAVA